MEFSKNSTRICLIVLESPGDLCFVEYLFFFPACVMAVALYNAACQCWEPNSINGHFQNEQAMLGLYSNAIMFSLLGSQMWPIFLQKYQVFEWQTTILYLSAKQQRSNTFLFQSLWLHEPGEPLDRANANTVPVSKWAEQPMCSHRGETKMTSEKVKRAG